MSNSPKLSNVQNERMGGLICVLCGRKPYEWLFNKLEVGGFAVCFEEKYSLTEKGERELERLLTLCGLAMFHRNGETEIKSSSRPQKPDY